MSRTKPLRVHRGTSAILREPMLLETERLILRRFRVADATFLLELVNDPAFIRFIGDRGLRTPVEAREYIRDRFLAGGATAGTGPYLVELKDTAVPIGLCSLLEREWLPDVDLGFAFLPPYRSRGYAFEASAALMAHAFHVFGFDRLVAITNPANEASIHLLGRLGFTFDRMIRSSDDEPELMLFAARKATQASAEAGASGHQDELERKST